MTAEDGGGRNQRRAAMVTVCSERGVRWGWGSGDDVEPATGMWVTSVCDGDGI
ncbi:hypothetical protein Hanom_Chr13g01229201 [Helianthus anomalus]